MSHGAHSFAGRRNWGWRASRHPSSPAWAQSARPPRRRRAITRRWSASSCTAATITPTRCRPTTRRATRSIRRSARTSRTPAMRLRRPRSARPTASAGGNMRWRRRWRRCSRCSTPARWRSRSTSARSSSRRPRRSTAPPRSDCRRNCSATTTNKAISRHRAPKARPRAGADEWAICSKAATAPRR